MLTHADGLATQVMEAAQKRLGPDYKFGDLSRAAADKLIQGACCTEFTSAVPNFTTNTADKLIPEACARLGPKP